VKSFTGRLSREGKLITDRVSGENDEVRTGVRVQWRGTVRFPIAERGLMFTSSSIRLDCADGFAVMIDLGDSTVSADGQWVVSEFLSNGPRLA
jgi:hypothetical protein